MMKNITFLMAFLVCNCFAQGSNVEGCREVYLENIKYCSVSFYEILANGQKYDGVKVRVVGYLKHGYGSAILSVDLASLEGTMILDNVIGLRLDKEALEEYSENDSHLVVVYGKYSSQSSRYVLARGELSEISLIEPHI